MHIIVKLLVLALLGFLIGPTCAYEYCTEKDNLCKGEKHFMCDVTSVPMNGVLVAIVPLTSKVRNHLIYFHNAYRNDTACGVVKDSKGTNFPKATRLRKMRWDNELAYIAQFHAERCNMFHDKCHNTDRFRTSGQNLFIGSGSAPKQPAMPYVFKGVTNWFNEHNLVQDAVQLTKKYPSNENWKEIGHFTAMLNDRVSHLGCAMTYCNSTDGKMFNYHLTCNYDYTNMQDHEMYSDGEIGSRCADWETSLSSDFPCLCENSGENFLPK